MAPYYNFYHCAVNWDIIIHESSHWHYPFDIQVHGYIVKLSPPIANFYVISLPFITRNLFTQNINPIPIQSLTLTNLLQSPIWPPVVSPRWLPLTTKLETYWLDMDYKPILKASQYDLFKITEVLVSLSKMAAI